MSEHFICSICGMRHEGMVTDQAYKLPDDVWNISDSERAENIKYDSDLCQFGKRFFIRGLLLVPFLNQPGAFGWGVWAEVEWSTFQRYLELYECDGSSEPGHRGTLANEVLGYPSSLGSAVDINFGDALNRPMIRFLTEDGGRFAMEQRDGMSSARYHQILDLIEAKSSSGR